MRCFKSQKICHTAIVPSQLWDGTDNNCKNKYYYFITFFSLLFHRYLSLSLSDSISFLLSLSLSISSLSSLLKKVTQDHSLVLAVISPPISPVLAASFYSPHRRHPQPSLPTFRSLLIGLWVRDLGWVSMWVLGRSFGSALCGSWAEALGRLGWGFRPIVGWVWVDFFFFFSFF